MSVEFTKENLDSIFKDLGKEFRRLNGTKMRAEIVLIGGGAVLANYKFREMTTDIDAIIRSSSVMKEAILFISDKYNLPHNWLNEGFKKTESYSEKLEEVSIYYKTFSNIMEIRAVSAEYLIAMKLMSGRLYKNDLSDIIGILLEHKINETPISYEAIKNAILKLYESKPLPDVSKELLDEIFRTEDYKSLYSKYRESEKEAKDLLLEFDRENPGMLKSENITSTIKMMRQRKQQEERQNANNS